MIKIRNEMTDQLDNPICEVICAPEVIAELKKLGVDLGRHSRPDAILATDVNKHPRPRTIVYEKLDGAYVKSSNRPLLKNPNVLALVKNYAYHEACVNDDPCVGNRPFTRFLTNDVCNFQSPRHIVTSEMAEKIKTGISFLHYKRLDRAAGQKPMEKNIDVFFAGTTDYVGKRGKNNESKTVTAGELITAHRRRMVEIIREYGRKNKLHVVATLERAMNIPLFNEFMARSKVTVSPWGWGEPCYRDYEAMMNDCEVIKPRSWRIDSNPDVYEGEALIWCCPDWSDLEAGLDAALNNFDNLKRRVRRWHQATRMGRTRGADDVAKILNDIIREVV